MRIRDLYEAPIVGVEPTGPENAEYGPSFSGVDAKKARSEKWTGSMVGEWRIKQKVRIFLMDVGEAVYGSVFDGGAFTWGHRSQRQGDHQAMDAAGGDGVLGGGVAPKKFVSLVLKRGYKVRPGEISYFLLGNTPGDQGTVPLSKWSLAHKLGHVIGPMLPHASICRIAAPLVAELDDDDAGGSTDADWLMYTLVKELSPFRSARKGLMEVEPEAIPELIAQRLVSGAVRFEAPKGASPGFVAGLRNLESTLDSMIDATLQWCVGRVLVGV